MTSKSDKRYLAQVNWRTRGQIEFFSWPAPPPPVLPTDILHELSVNDKIFLFEDFKPTQEAQAAKGKALLVRLEQLDPDLAAKFELKPDLILDFTLRLINGEESPERSYIALSYCWSPKYNQLLKEDTKFNDVYPIPLSSLLFQAAIAERNAANEGLWIDQICIDQKNKEEKKTAIAAMDAVYKHARSVFVALEDIEVSEAEQEFFKKFIPEFESNETILSRPHFGEQPAYMEKNIILRNFFRKITSSRWFTRAWCSHEMRLGQKHTFYISCEVTGPHNRNLVLGFTGDFLWYMCALATEIPSSDKQNQKVKSVIAMNFDMQMQMDKVRRIMRGQPGDVPSDITDYTSNIAQIFELDAGGDPDLPEEMRIADANCDKISITLNILGNGLNLSVERGSVAMTQYASVDECYRQLLILALAAGDLSSLCGLGKPLRPNPKSPRSSWLCQPTHLDAGSAPEFDSLPIPSTLAVKLDPSAQSSWIELDGTNPTEPEIPFTCTTECAKKLIEKCRSLGLGLGPGGLIISDWGPGPDYQYWRYQTDLDTGMRYRFVATLRFVLHAGLTWATKVAENSGFPRNKLPAWKEALVDYFCDGEFNIDELDSENWATTQPGRDAMNALMRFVNWLVTWGQQSVHDIPSTSEIWLPMMYKAGWGGRVLIFMYPLRSKDETLAMDASGMRLFLPTCLMRDEYSRLARVWILNMDEEMDEDKIKGANEIENLGKEMDQIMRISPDTKHDENPDADTDTNNPKWVLKGKARLFSDVSISLETTKEWEKRDQMRVYGPR
ncbi:heterokaryon incompatibility protein-domain-containing protein [Xylogone sp. PMI_703]|nr:heterokaryon incompatibility protein-domain-containing protein [Xylogone sp. PMI_703]